VHPPNLAGLHRRDAVKGIRLARTVRAAAAVLASLGLALGLAEATLRIGTGAEFLLRPFPNVEWMALDPVLGWRNRPDVHRSAPDPGLRFAGADLDTDARGLQRTPAGSTGRTRIQILCLGDSGTFGIWWKRVPDDTVPALHGIAGYPHALDRALRSRGHDDVEIINAGVIGYTSAHGLRQLTTLLHDARPDITLVRFGYNDHARAWDPALRVPEPASPFARWLLTNASRWQVARLALAGYQRAPLHPAPDSVPWVSPEQFASNLRRLAEVLRERGSQVLFLDYPLRPRSWGRFPEDSIHAALTGAEDVDALYRNHAEYQSILSDVAARDGLHRLETRAALTRREDRFFEDSDLVHPNDRGANALAELIATELEARGWTEKVPRRN
jgi:lysophospholipase L1-like esterase